MLTQLILLSIIPILYLVEYYARRKGSAVSHFEQDDPAGMNGNFVLPLTSFESIIALAVFAVLSIGFAYFTGILTSGFHLVDDYETLGILGNIDSYGLVEALRIRLSEDLYARFRPTYCFIRVIQTYIFGSDYYAWHMMYAIITALVLYMAYIYARTRGVYMWMSYVAAVAIYIGGGQSSVMWRLGPQEGLGLLLFMSALMCLRWYRRNRSSISFIVLVVLTVLLSGSKEAFLVLLPCLPAMLIVWEVEEQGDISFKIIRQAIVRNIVYICITIAICVTDILVILFGINNLNYIDEQYLGESEASFGLYDYIRGIGASVLRGFLPYFIIFLAANIILFIQLYRHRRDADKSYLIKHILILLISDVMVVLQIIMYSKYHMRERYIIPASVFVAALWYIGTFRLLKPDKPGKIYHAHIVLSIAFACLLFLIRYDTVSTQYLYPGNTDQAMAVDYARDGADSTAALNLVGRVGADRKVCIIMYGENAASAGSYLSYFYGIKEIDASQSTDYENNVIYVGYKSAIGDMLNNSDRSVNEVNAVEFGNYMVAY